MAGQSKITHNPYVPVVGPRAQLHRFARLPFIAIVPLDAEAKNPAPERECYRPSQADGRIVAIFLGQLARLLGPVGIRRLLGAATGGAPIHFVDVHYQHGHPKGTATIYVNACDVDIFLAANRQIRVLADCAIVATPGAPREAILEAQKVFLHGGFSSPADDRTPLPRHLMTVELYRANPRAAPPQPLLAMMPLVLPSNGAAAAAAAGELTPNGVSSASDSLVQSPALPAVSPATHVAPPPPPPALLPPTTLQPCRNCPSCARALTF